MIPVTVSSVNKVSRDPNWGLEEFWYDGWDDELIKYGKNDEEYKSMGEHSKKVYDWEILELFFTHTHNLDPIFKDQPVLEEEELVNEVKNTFFHCRIY